MLASLDAVLAKRVTGGDAAWFRVDVRRRGGNHWLGDFLILIFFGGFFQIFFLSGRDSCRVRGQVSGRDASAEFGDSCWVGRTARKEETNGSYTLEITSV